MSNDIERAGHSGIQNDTDENNEMSYPNPRHILQPDLDFILQRSDKVIDTCAWLWPIMNRVHQTEFSQTFWTRILAHYVSSTFNQKKYYQQSEFKPPVLFQPINGWTPASRLSISKNKILTILKTLRGKYRTNSIPENGLGFSRIGLGIRAERFCTDLDAVPLSLNWLSCIRRADRRVRKNINTEASKITDAEKRNVLIGMPRIFVEILPAIFRVATKLASTKIEKIFVEHYGSEFENILAACLAEKGSSIYQLQTGGFVGETVNSLLPINKVKYDFQLTYGWVESEKDIPYYAVRLEQFAEKYKSRKISRKNIDLLVVFGSQANSESLLNYYEVCSDLLFRELNRDRFPNILLRPRAQSRFLRMAEIPKCFNRFKRAEIDSGQADISGLCARSRVVVHWTMPSTNFLECLFLNHPVVAVDTNYFPTEIVRPYIKQFKNMKVLHDDPRSLIDFLNTVDVEGWWGEVCSSEAYIDFKLHFTRSRNQYLALLGEDPVHEAK